MPRKVTWLLWLALLAAPSLAAPGDKFLLLPDSVASVDRAGIPYTLEHSEAQAAVIRVAPEAIEALSEAIHREFRSCGGFFDVTDEVESGVSPARIVSRELARRRSPKRKVEFAVQEDPKVRALVSRIDADRMWTFLTEFSALSDRSATTDLGTKAVDLLSSKISALASNVAGLSVTKVPTPGYPKQPSLVATLEGADPAAPHVVIGGHLDTLSSNKPGADDDGTGSALVLEVLRVVLESKAKFDHTIDFVWYAAEERGLVGSSAVVKQFKAKGISVKAAIQFDMTGYKRAADKEDIYLVTDYTDSSLNAALKTLIGLYTQAKVGETKCGYACSDHASWNRGGIPAAFPFEATFGKDNPNVHTSEDKISYLTKEHALPFAQTGAAFLGDIAKLRFLTLSPLSNSPSRVASRGR